MDNEYEGTTCPACDGPGAYLGTLGRLDHWRCRDCGAQFSLPTQENQDV